MKETEPLTREAQPELDRIFPGFSFMTMANTATGIKRLVATTRNVLDVAVYEEQTLEQHDALAKVATTLVAKLSVKVAKPIWKRGIVKGIAKIIHGQPGTRKARRANKETNDVRD